MKNYIILLLLIFTIYSAYGLTLTSSGKKVIVVGAGVTGTWAAAKIAENLTQDDELIIVSPPTKEIVKPIGKNVFINYTTSSFIPIGIQSETGVINLEPPEKDELKNLHEFHPHTKLYLSQHLDKETKNKLNYYLAGNNNSRSNSILLHYHRDICLPEWKKYLKQGGKGADITSVYPVVADKKILEKMRDKIIKNRIDAGYLSESNQLKIVASQKLSAIMPDYSPIIHANKLNGLIGLHYDGRVRNAMVMESLHNKINQGKAKVTRINAWVDKLQTNTHHIVTGIKLKNNKILQADVVVLATGQGIEKILNQSNIPLTLPILKKWGVVYSLINHPRNVHEQPTLMMKGLGITRDMPNQPMTFAVGEWILAKDEQPQADKVIGFVKQAILIWNKEFDMSHWENNHLPIYVQPRPMTLDGFPVLDSSTKGLIILNPSGSQGNIQAPGSAYFAAYNVIKQLGRPVPENLKLPSTIEWKEFELYPGRFM